MTGFEPTESVGAKPTLERPERLVLNEPGANRPCGYRLVLGERFSVSLRAVPSAAGWLTSLAAIMGLRAGVSEADPTIWFSRRSRWSGLKYLTRRWMPDSECRESGGLPADGWQASRVGYLTLATHSSASQEICELGPSRNEGREILMMWQFLQMLYPALLRHGGFPLHAALVEHAGRGIVLVGSEGVGKTTACRRLVHPWHALADDAVVVLPDRSGTFFAYPFPTWSDVLRGEGPADRSVEHGVPLSAVLFLEQGSEDCLIPVGQGHTAVMLAGSAAYLWLQAWGKSGDASHAGIRRDLFDRCSTAAGTLPGYRIQVSLTGRYWEPMSRTLDEQGCSDA